MSDTIAPIPNHDETNEEAVRLRHRHEYWSDALVDAEGISDRARQLREQITHSPNPEGDFSYQDRAFANGEATQRQMLQSAKLHYNANMWEAQEHYRANKDQYVDLALQDAKNAGVEVSGFDDSQERRHKEIDLLFHNPAVTSISFRRHGAYERSQDSVRRGQLTRETMGDVKAAAKEWVDLLPDDVELDFVTSPTGMPATGPTGKNLMPARARMTGALYGAVLRDRYGDNFTRLAQQERSAANQDLPTVEINTPRTTDQRLGDIFEFTTKEESKHIPTFFKELSVAYGGMTPDFWQDYIRGTLPEAVQEAFIAGGGDTALEKSIMATDWILEHIQLHDNDKKHVALAISHEEVIGSIAFQIAEYLRDTKQLSPEEIHAVESEKISYNQGFDLHVDEDGVAAAKIGEAVVLVNLHDLKRYLDRKKAESIAE